MIRYKEYAVANDVMAHRLVTDPVRYSDLSSPDHISTA